MVLSISSISSFCQSKKKGEVSWKYGNIEPPCLKLFPSICAIEGILPAPKAAAGVANANSKKQDKRIRDPGLVELIAIFDDVEW